MLDCPLKREGSDEERSCDTYLAPHPDGGCLLMDDSTGGLPTPFAEAVLDLVAQIPSGRVLSYGDVAELLEDGSARAVATVMSRFGSPMPWWRVVRSDGTLPEPLATEAAEHYEWEGTPRRGIYRVEMRRARWTPPDAARA